MLFLPDDDHLKKDCDTAESGRVVRAPHMLEEK